ncbi:MAG: hypothetical protein AAF501_10515, partial [Pseudomonadota bacterium]
RLRTELCGKYDPEARSGTRFLNYHARLDEAGLLLRFWTIPTAIFHTLISTTLNTNIVVVACCVFAGVYVPLRVLLMYEPMILYEIDAATIPLAKDWLPYLLLPDWVVTPLIWVETVIVLPIADFAIWLLRVNFVDQIDVMEAQRELFPIAFLVSGPFVLIALFMVTALTAPFAVFLPWYFGKQKIAFGGEKLAWSIAANINVDQMARNDAEMRRVFLPGAWRQGQWQHNFYYCNKRLITELADRLTNWDVRPSRTWNLERLIFTGLRLCVQLFTLWIFLYVSIALLVNLGPSVAAM